MTTFTAGEAATLPQRLRRLETAEKARELLADYALAVDRKDVDALAGLFTEQAVLHAGSNTFTGQSGVTDFFRHTFEVIDPSVKKHLIANHRVTHLSPGEARVDSYFLYTSVGTASIMGWGSYVDMVRIDEDDVARFTEKYISVDVAADVREGWAAR